MDIHGLVLGLNQKVLPDTGAILKTSSGYLIGWGTTAGNGVQGWAPSAIFFDTDGVLYENKGSVTSASWKTVTTAA